MENKIFMNAEGMATISCPECKNSVTKNIGEYQLIDKVKRIHCSCSCGHSFKVIIEKRHYFRKGTFFSGKYKSMHSDGLEKYGLLYVLDVSQSGLLFKINIEPVFNVGDKIWVEFYIDEEGDRLVRKEGIIRSIRGKKIGMEFPTTEHYDEYGKLLIR